MFEEDRNGGWEEKERSSCGRNLHCLSDEVIRPFILLPLVANRDFFSFVLFLML